MNEELKQDFREKGIPQWKLARELGIGESTFCRRLRFELDSATKNKIYAALDKLEMEERFN